jgi:glyoxylase-like metal-dependent hydrolase (beta-lactamase superfamily II)
MKKLTDGAWLVAMGAVNAVLLEQEDRSLVLIDAGFPDKEDAVLEAIAELGRRPEDLAHIVFTHSHPDHIGSAAALVERTGAATWMHPLDAPIAESGGPFRPLKPTRRFPQILLYAFFGRVAKERVAPVRIDHRIEDGDTLPLAGGLQVVHTPGHSAGHVSLLWPAGELLLVGDVGSNVLGIADPIGYEDLAVLRESQAKLAALSFERAAFGHGSAILDGATTPVRKAWARKP